MNDAKRDPRTPRNTPTNPDGPRRSPPDRPADEQAHAPTTRRPTPEVHDPERDTPGLAPSIEDDFERFRRERLRAQGRDVPEPDAAEGGDAAAPEAPDDDAADDDGDPEGDGGLFFGTNPVQQRRIRAEVRDDRSDASADGLDVPAAPGSPASDHAPPPRKPTGAGRPSRRNTGRPAPPKSQRPRPGSDAPPRSAGRPVPGTQAQRPRPGSDAGDRVRTGRHRPRGAPGNDPSPASAEAPRPEPAQEEPVDDFERFRTQRLREGKGPRTERSASGPTPSGRQRPTGPGHDAPSDRGEPAPEDPLDDFERFRTQRLREGKGPRRTERRAPGSPDATDRSEPAEPEQTEASAEATQPEEEGPLFFGTSTQERRRIRGEVEEWRSTPQAQRRPTRRL